MHIPRKPEAVVVAASLLLLVGAVLGAFQGRDDGGPEMATGTTIEIKDFQFGPVELTTSLGDTVTWSNRDEAAHTVRGNDKLPTMSEDLAQGATYSFTFDMPGTYEYSCTIHPSMRGTVVVRKQ